MNQLSTLSTAADTDLLLVYDIDEGGTEKTKTITYSEFETQISGSVGGGGGPYNSLVDGGETGALYTNGGALELNYDGTKVFETYTNGASSRGIILTDAASTLQIKGQPNIWEFINDAHGYGYNFKGENISGTPVTMCTMDPDTGSVFNYGTIPVFKTIQYGAQISYSWKTATFECGLGTLLITNDSEGYPIELRAKKTGPTADTLVAKFDPDGAAELYYAGTKVIATASWGPEFYSANDNAHYMTTWFDATSYQFLGRTHGAAVGFYGENNSGTVKNLIKADPDGAAELYYQGAKTFETRNNGILITGGNSYPDASARIYWLGTASFSFLNEETSGSYNFSSKNSSGTIRTSFETNVETFTIYDVEDNVKVMSTQDGRVNFYGNSGIEFGRIEHNDTDLTLINYTDDGLLYLKGQVTSNNTKTLFVGDPAGAAELYHAGEKQFETVVSGVEIPEDSFMYFGDTTTSGSWRMGIAGEDFIHQKYDGADWVTKQTVVG